MDFTACLIEVTVNFRHRLKVGLNWLPAPPERGEGRIDEEVEVHGGTNSVHASVS